MSIAYDNSLSDTIGSNESYSQSFTVGTGDDRYLLVFLWAFAGSDAACDYTSVQFGGTAMTLVGTIGTNRYGNYCKCSVYRMLAPASGSSNFTCQANISLWNGGVHILALEGVAQEAPEATASDSDNSSSLTSFSTSITTLTDNAWVVDGLLEVGGTASSLSEDSGQTGRSSPLSVTSTVGSGVSTELQATAGSETQGWSWTNNSNMVIHYLLSLAPADAGISYVGTDTSTSTGDTLVLDVPTGTQDGDLLIAYAMVQDNDPTSSWTAPSGWTEYVDELDATPGTSKPYMSVYYRIADSEPSSYTWTCSASGRGLMGAMCAYRGVDEFVPFDATRTTAQGSTEAKPNPPSITTVTAGAWVVAVGFEDDDAGFTSLSSGYTSRVNFGNDSGSSNGGSLGVCDLPVATPAATDPGVFSGPANEAWGAVTMALRPDTGIVPMTGSSAGVASVSGALAVKTTLAGSAAGVASVSGAVAVSTTLAGQADGVADVSGELEVATTLAGQADGVATVSGELAVATTLAGQADGVATVDASVAVLTRLLGAADGAADVAGTLVCERVLDGDTAGEAEVTAALAVLTQLVASVAGVSTVTASLDVRTTLEGQADGEATVDGTLNAALQLQGASDGASTAQGALEVLTRLAGQADGEAAVAGSLGVLTALAGATAGEATVSGSLDVLTTLEGGADGVADVAGALTEVHYLEGQADGVATVGGDLSVTTVLEGAAAGEATVQGTFGLLHILAAESNGEATVSAALDVTTRVQGQADGVATVDAVLDSIRLLEGTSDGVANVFADLTVNPAFLDGASDGQAGVDGSLAVLTQLAANVLGLAEVGGTLSVKWVHCDSSSRGRARVSGELVCVRLVTDTEEAPQRIETTTEVLPEPQLETDDEVLDARIITNTRKL